MKWQCVLVVIYVLFKDRALAVDNELMQVADKRDNAGLLHPVEETPQSRVDGSAEPGSKPEAPQVQDIEPRNGALSHPGPLTQLLLSTTKQPPVLGTGESGQLKPEEDQTGDPLNRDKRHHHYRFKSVCIGCGGGYYVEPAYVEPAVYVKKVYVRPEVYVKPAYEKTIIGGGGYAGAFAYSHSASGSASFAFGKKK